MCELSEEEKDRMKRVLEEEIQIKLFKSAVDGEKGLIEALSKKYNPKFVEEHLTRTPRDKGHFIFSILDEENNYHESVGYSCSLASEGKIFPFDPFTAERPYRGFHSRPGEMIPAFECKYCGFIQEDTYMAPGERKRMLEEMGIKQKD